MITATSNVTTGPDLPPVAAGGSVAATNQVNANELFALELDEEIAAQNQSAASNDNVLLASDLVSLSPQALSILAGANVGATATVNPATTVDSTGTAQAAAQTAPLTFAQEQQIAGVVAQFANAPFTSDTFAQIQAALEADGINPQQVSLQSMLLAFNISPFGSLAFNDQVLTESLATEELAA